jgi:hypothetical protein
LPGRADVVMTMFRDKDYISSHGVKADFLAVSTESSHAGKNRDAQTETIRGAYLQSADEYVSFAFDELPPISVKSHRVIMRLTSEMTVQEYSTNYKISESAARRELQAGVREGDVVEVRSPNPNVAVRFSPRQGSEAPLDWAKLSDHHRE